MTARVDVRTEALTTIAHGFRTFEVRVTDILRDFEGRARRAHEVLAAELDRRVAELARAREALARADERSAAQCRARVQAAENAVRVARNALTAVENELSRVRAAIRRYLMDARRNVAAAQSHLRTLGANIELYAAGAAGGGASGGSTRRAAPIAPPGSGTGADGARDAGLANGAGRLEAVLATMEFELVDVQRPDYSDNPIKGWSKGGATIVDYRWAVDTWDRQVAALVAQGRVRNDLETLDRSRGATGFRRLAGVWDLFLESEPITLEEDASGRMTVLAGRHRLEAARQLGVTHLPARVNWTRR